MNENSRIPASPGNSRGQRLRFLVSLAARVGLGVLVGYTASGSPLFAAVAGLMAGLAYTQIRAYALSFHQRCDEPGSRFYKISCVGAWYSIIGEGIFMGLLWIGPQAIFGTPGTPAQLVESADLAGRAALVLFILTIAQVALSFYARPAAPRTEESAELEDGDDRGEKDGQEEHKAQEDEGSGEENSTEEDPEVSEDEIYASYFSWIELGMAVLFLIAVYTRPNIFVLAATALGASALSRRWDEEVENPGRILSLSMRETEWNGPLGDLPIAVATARFAEGVYWTIWVLWVFGNTGQVPPTTPW